MRHSLEHLGSSRNMDTTNDPEGIKNTEVAAQNPASFKEHMKELRDLIDSLPTDDNKEMDKAIENLAKKQATEDARNAVLQVLHKDNPTTHNTVKEGHIENSDDYDQKLSDISATF